MTYYHNSTTVLFMYVYVSTQDGGVPWNREPYRRPHARRQSDASLFIYYPH